MKLPRTLKELEGLLKDCENVAYARGRLDEEKAQRKDRYARRQEVLIRGLEGLTSLADTTEKTLERMRILIEQETAIEKEGP